MPQEIEPIPLTRLLTKRPENNIYLNCVDVARRAEHIVTDLSHELRERLQTLDLQEDALRLRDGDASMIEEIRREVEAYRGLPKPALVAIWEALSDAYPTAERPSSSS